MTAQGAPLAGIPQRPRHEVVINEGWLDSWREDILDPGLPIVDAHHHLWTRGDGYLLSDYTRDTTSGHNVVASVPVQCAAMYRSDGPAHLRPAGEVEFLAGAGATGSQLCAGIVGYADLLLGRGTDEVFAALVSAGQGRLRGVRFSTHWDGHEAFAPFVVNPHDMLMEDERFREGFSLLEQHGLSFDAWTYHPQLPQVADLARAFPRTTIIVNHMGGPLRIGPYSCANETFETWSRAVRRLAQHANVNIKLGGLGMPIGGLGFSKRDRAPSSAEVSEAYRPYVETCIEAFGTHRCMFESNFPADKASYSYPVIWNAFKRLTQEMTAHERADLFAGTATRVYRLDDGAAV
jgi:L-fuconolactonase